ncbi:hypothetical protein KY332_01745 [Candidatus Woesearchaeota archaeon]|nr:hypothetical protein [Candidatus Woesearchaeota archaeon]
MNIDALKGVFGSTTKACEIMYLMYGKKPVVRQGFYDNEVGRVKEFCRRHNLAYETAPYKVILADTHKRYSNKGLKARIDDPRRGMFFIYMSKDETKAAEARIHEMKDNHRELGFDLGYPECCVEFFAEKWEERSRLDNDYIFPALHNSDGFRFSFHTNILKRSKDVTLLNHFPHSFQCEESIELAKRHLKMLMELEPGLAMRIVRELKCKVRVGSKIVEFS